MARARSRGGPRWRLRSALILLGAILGMCLTGVDSYAVLPVNHLTPDDFLAVPSTCDGVELTNPTFPAANASVVYKEFSPDSGASRFLSVCVFLCPGVFQTAPRDGAVASAREPRPRASFSRADAAAGAVGNARRLPGGRHAAARTRRGRPRRADRRHRPHSSRTTIRERHFQTTQFFFSRRGDEAQKPEDASPSRERLAHLPVFFSPRPDRLRENVQRT